MIFELDKKVLLYWRFTAAVLFAAVFSAIVLTLSNYAWLCVGLCGTVLCLASVVLYIYLPKLWRSETVLVENGRIICRKGIFIKREYIYPKARLVYVQRVKPPLAGCFGLQIIITKGVGHNLFLPPMTHSQASLFRKAVQQGE